MITLRLDKNGGINKGDIKAFEHDNLSEVYVIQLYKNGAIYDLTNKTVELTIVEKKRKLGDMISLPIYEATEGKVKLEVVSDITKQDGIYDFKLTVKDTTGLIETFPNFQVKIENDITDSITGEIIQDPNFTILTEGLKALADYNIYKTNALKVPEIEKNIVELNEQLDTNANEINAIKPKLESIASGSPKGVYSSLEELKLAFPNGNNNIYIVETDWVYWNGSAWTIGGVYQSSGLDVSTVKDIFNYSITNNVKNGDFSDGTENWNTSYRITNVSTAYDGITFTPTGQWGGIESSLFNITRGHKYFVYAELTGNVNTYINVDVLERKYKTKTGFEQISYISTASETKTTKVAISNNATSGWIETKANKIMVIDLTEAFGLGNEPELEVMNEFLKAYKNSYIKDVKSLLDTDVFEIKDILNNNIVVDYMSIPIINRIKNGDFENGIDDWTQFKLTDLTFENGISFTPTAQWGGIESNTFDIIQGHKYYTSVLFTEGGTDGYVSTSGIGKKNKTKVGAERVSFILSATETKTTKLAICSSATTGFTKMSFNYVMIIDLTEIFGSGNELSLSDFEKYLEAYKKGYIKDTRDSIYGDVLLLKESVKNISKEAISNSQIDISVSDFNGGYVENNELIINNATSSYSFSSDVRFIEVEFEAKTDVIDDATITLMFGANSAIKINDTYYKKYKIRGYSNQKTISSAIKFTSTTSTLRVKNLKITFKNELERNRKDTIRFIGHRGTEQFAPESTIHAYEYANKAGMWGVECDIYRTSDGVWVLSHDATIDRCSDGSGKINEMTYEQLLQYDFGSWKGEEFTGTKIMTLDEFMSFCKQTGMNAYVELKDTVTSDNVDSIYEPIIKNGMIKHTTFLSTDFAKLRIVANKNSNVRIAYAAPIEQWSINELKELSNECVFDTGFYYFGYPLTNIKLAHQNNIEVEAWIVNDLEEYRELINAGIDGITTDVLNMDRCYI